MKDLIKSFNCPVRWRCLSLDQTVTVGPTAAYDISNGWICDCGKRVKGDDVGHEVLIYGLRDACDYNKQQDTKQKSKTKEKIKCLSCKKIITKKISGLELCKECYDYEKQLSQNPLTKCVECGKPTNREILGVYVCYQCYGYDFYNPNFVREDGVTVRGLNVIDCSIEYHPDKGICKNCPSKNDCSQHYVFVDTQKELVVDYEN